VNVVQIFMIEMAVLFVGAVFWLMMMNWNKD